MFLIVSNVYSQFDNLLTNSEIDSLNAKLLHRKQLIKEVNSLGIALSYSDSICKAYKSQILILNTQKVNLQDINNSLNTVISNKDKKFNNQKKIYKRKTLFNYLKGVVIGGGLATFILLSN